MARYPKPRPETIAKAKERWIAGDPPAKIGKMFGRHASWVYNLSVREKWGRRGGEYVAPIVTRRCEDCWGLYQSPDNDFSGHGEACPRARRAA